MNKTKNFRFSLVTACLLVGIGMHTALAGIPVIDGPAQGQRTQLQMQNEMHRMQQVQLQMQQQQQLWQQQSQQMSQQIDRLQTQIQRLDTQISNSKSTTGVSLNINDFKTSGLDVAAQGYANSPPSLGSDAVKKYLGDSQYCRGSSGPGYSACIGLRNIKAAMLADLDNMLKQTNTRVTYVNQLIQQAGKSGMTPGQIQALTAQINGYQALLQTDAARMNTTTAIYQQRLDLYQQQLTDYTNRVLYGSGASGGATGGLPLKLTH